MKNKNLLYLFFVTLFTVTTGCIKDRIQPNKEDYSAESLFRGIMYGEGKVADLIPQVKLNKIAPEDIFSSNEDLKVVIDIRNQILNSIKKNNPLFLDEFKKNVSSHDPIKIQEALKQAGTNIYKALLEISNIKTTEEKILFDKKLIYTTKNIVVVKQDGSLDKEETKAKLHELVSVQKQYGIKKELNKLDHSLSVKNKFINNLLQNSTQTSKDVNTGSKEVCIAVTNVVVAATVVAAVIVEAAVVTDTWFWVTSDAVATPVDSKILENSLYREDFVASIAESI